MPLPIFTQTLEGKVDKRRGAEHMKQLKCLCCNKIWYVDDTELDSVNTCPFCSTLIRHRDSIGDIDTLGKALYKAISTEGLDLLMSSGKISGYLLDLIPDLKKEVRIFTKTFDDDYIALYRSAFDQNENDILVTINKLKSLFIEEEGLSEVWADMLCENCQIAISYYKGKGLPDVLSAEIDDIDSEHCGIVKEEPKTNNSSLLSIPSRITTGKSEKTEIKNNAPLSIDYKVGQVIKFGRHENGDPMHWRIIEIDDRLSLLHYSGADLEQRFHDKDIDVLWKDCKLREWLNHDFIVQHFTSEEEKLIFQVNIETAGIITQDKVFCLSINEANKYKKYMKDSYKPWLLRDKGKENGYIATYEHDGPYLWGVGANNKRGIRPALYISKRYFTN